MTKSKSKDFRKAISTSEPTPTITTPIPGKSAPITINHEPPRRALRLSDSPKGRATVLDPIFDVIENFGTVENAEIGKSNELIKLKELIKTTPIGTLSRALKKAAELDKLEVVKCLLENVDFERHHLTFARNECKTQDNQVHAVITKAIEELDSKKQTEKEDGKSRTPSPVTSPRPRKSSERQKIGSTKIDEGYVKRKTPTSSESASFPESGSDNSHARSY
jgi:hypothetical protein